MANAFSGQVLHVDLTESKWWTEGIAEKTYRHYLGGGPLATHFMLRDLKPGVDPLGPENLFIVMTSVINGLPISGANRYSAAGKSPLTGGFGESEAGGYWGPELKRTGFDGIIVHGRAHHPVYLFVHDNQCEIRDARPYWGQLSGEVQEGLESELGDKSIRVLQTGVAGENLVRYAAVCNQLRHFHGRAGLGAVMGSKNLKAIVTRGRDKVAPHDRTAAGNVLKWFRDNYNNAEEGLHLTGTAGGVVSLDHDGILPTHNFQDGSFEHAHAITGTTMAETILVHRGTCYACAVACKREVEVAQRGVSPLYGGMEYEVIGALGSLCGVGDLAAIAEASQWVNRYVMDGISTGAAIAFAIECHEKGLLSNDDVDGIDLHWGNAEAVIQMIHKIARREGIGNLLAEGTKRAAAAIGHGAERFALHVKGQELPMHEPRGKVGVGLGYAISPTGADHLEAEHDPVFETLDEADGSGLGALGLRERVSRLDFGAEKVRTFFYSQMLWSLYNAVGMCKFVGAPIGKLRLEPLQAYVNAATGWNMSQFELLKVGERANTMARLFNLREGMTATDDALPDRLFEPLRNGALKGKHLDRQEFHNALQLYYSMAGWDENGAPTKGKLAELGLTSLA